MFRSLKLVCGVAMAIGMAATGASAQAIPEGLQAIRPPSQSLSGPRFGMTLFTGDIADFRESSGKDPFITQFGWQWETQLVSTETGGQALLEWLLLVGGVEQGETNVSVSFLAGLRTASGIEFGAGPNLSVSPDHSQVTRSMVMAAGVTLPVGGFRVPANMAVAFAPGGPRISFLTGWVVGT